MENARKNPQLSSKCRDRALAIFGRLNCDPNTEELAELTDIIYKLWNVDGIELGENAINHIPLHRHSKIIAELLERSEHEGSGYMQQLMQYLTFKNLLT